MSYLRWDKMCSCNISAGCFNYIFEEKSQLLYFIGSWVEVKEKALLLEVGCVCGGVCFENSTLMRFACLLAPPPGWIGEYRSSRHCWWKSQTDSRAHLEHHSPLAGVWTRRCISISFSLFFQLNISVVCYIKLFKSQRNWDFFCFLQ